jgi:hypothetical protein
LVIGDIKIQDPLAFPPIQNIDIPECEDSAADFNEKDINESEKKVIFKDLAKNIVTHKNYQRLHMKKSNAMTPECSKSKKSNAKEENKKKSTTMKANNYTKDKQESTECGEGFYTEAKEAFKQQNRNEFLEENKYDPQSKKECEKFFTAQSSESIPEMPENVGKTPAFLKDSRNNHNQHKNLPKYVKIIEIDNKGIAKKTVSPTKK